VRREMHGKNNRVFRNVASALTQTRYYNIIQTPFPPSLFLLLSGCRKGVSMSIATDISTLTTQLAAVNSAIATVLTGQEYSVGNSRFRRADLGELRKWRSEIQRELGNLTAINSGSNRIYVERSTT